MRQLSYKAISWAMSQPVEKSSAKFVLVAMADCVNADSPEMVCWASTKRLCDTTGQDRKTVLENMRRLREGGHIVPTGDRKGETGQILVYLLKSPNNGTVKTESRNLCPDRNSTENGPSNDTEIGTVEAIERVPDFPTKSTENGHKEAQISLETVPKAGHEPVIEPVHIQEVTSKKKRFDAGAIQLPNWLPVDAWQSWTKDRTARGKSISERGAELQIKSLCRMRDAGHDPVYVIENAIEKGWTGLYAPSANAAPVVGGKKLNPQEALEASNRAVGEQFLAERRAHAAQ